MVLTLPWTIAALCFILGLALVIFEMFHPGFGAPGITGCVLLLLGILLTAKNILTALIMVIVLLAILGVALVIVLRSASKGYISRNLVLYDSMSKASGFGKPEDLDFLIDKEGVALTVLRPAGSADIDGLRLDVVSEGDFIPKNSRIKVIKVDGHRIVVKQIK